MGEAKECGRERCAARHFLENIWLAKLRPLSFRRRTRNHEFDNSLFDLKFSSTFKPSSPSTNLLEFIFVQ